MPAKIVEVNFGLNVSGAEYRNIVEPLAEQFAALPGLQWKIWLVDEATHQAGGVYFFEDEASATAFLDGPLAASCMAHPALADISTRTFDIIEDLTAITRGPVKAAVPV